ncbi:MAG: FAD-dependent oxidoreductase [Pseudomonadota bacterium]
MSADSKPIQSIAIIGAGIIGLSCAIELADRGLQVSLFDKAWPPRGASWAAAGMLAPAFESIADPGTHPKLFDLCDESACLWPGWAQDLEQRTGLSAGYHPGPSLAIARDPAQAQKLTSVTTTLQARPDAPEDCTSRVQTIEPAIRADVQSAILLPSDGQADNRKTLAALVTCAEGHPNISIYPHEAPLRSVRNELDHAGHDATLLTAGWSTAVIAVEESGSRVPILNWDVMIDEIDCYGGQMLAVAPVEGAPKMTVRCGHIYIVPKADRIIIGATTEPGRVLEHAEPAVIADLHRRAAEICPALATAPVLESWVGIRPGTHDHAPFLGETETPGLFVASGHYRNGILLAPITAKIMADLIVERRSSELAQAFLPQARLAAAV